MIEFELANSQPVLRASGYATAAFVHAVVSEPDGVASRFMQALSGEVPIDSYHATYLDLEPTIVRISSEHHFLEPLTIADNLIEWWVVQGLSEADATKRAKQGLTKHGLLDMYGKYPSELSELKRIQLMALVSMALPYRVLLIDDPLANVAPEDMQEGLAWLSHIVQTAKGVVLIHTADPTISLGLSDRVMMFNEGELCSHDTTHGVLRSPVNEWANRRLGNTYRGNLHNGVITMADGRKIVTFDKSYSGQVIAFVNPRAVSLSRERPVNIPRNLWHGRIAGLEGVGDSVRVNILGNTPLVAEVTPETVSALTLPMGGPIWASFKASQVNVTYIATAKQLERYKARAL